MNWVAKSGRAAWSLYVVASVPLAMFLLVMVLVALGMMVKGEADLGPVNFAMEPVSLLWAMRLVVVMYPLLWIANVALAWRFEAPEKRFLPLVNALVMVVLAKLFHYGEQQDCVGEDFFWMYPAGLLVLLVWCLVAAVWGRQTGCVGNWRLSR